MLENKFETHVNRLCFMTGILGIVAENFILFSKLFISRNLWSYKHFYESSPFDSLFNNRVLVSILTVWLCLLDLYCQPKENCYEKHKRHFTGSACGTWLYACHIIWFVFQKTRRLTTFVELMFAVIAFE